MYNIGFDFTYSGLMPRLLGEIITVWLTAGFAYIVNRYLLPDDVDPKFKEQTPYVASVSFYCVFILKVKS